jgi:hypothetical protein
MEIGDLLAKIQSVDFMKLFDEALEKVFPNIIQLIQEQLSEGETALGSMPDYKSDVYANFKEKYVATYKIYPTTDLRVTGNLYEGIFVQNGLLSIEISSRDPKSAKLEKKYGQRIYVLNEKSMDKLRPILYTILMNNYRHAIGFN